MRPVSKKKEKVTILVDTTLLHAVDSFVEQSGTPGLSRSSIIEPALSLWKQEMRDEYDAKFYSDNPPSPEDKTWWAVKAEAAEQIWKD